MNLKLKNKQGNILAEMLVGLSISLLTLLAVAVINIFFEKQNNNNKNLERTLSNASSAFYALKIDAKNAGFGLNLTSSLFGCEIDNTLIPSNKFKMLPAYIDRTNSKPELFFNSGSSYLSTIPSLLTKVSSGSTLNLSSAFAYQKNDYIAISPAVSNKCGLFKMVSDPDTDNIISVNATANNYSANSYVNNFGKNPHFFKYSVDNNYNLIKTDLLNGQVSLILSNVVDIGVKYGISNGTGTGTMSWVDNIDPTDVNKFKLLRAIKLAILVRSPAFEGANNCEVTDSSTKFYWGDSNQDLLTIPNTSDARCYRYRVLTTTIPLKNMVYNKLN